MSGLSLKQFLSNKFGTKTPHHPVRNVMSPLRGGKGGGWAFFTLPRVGFWGGLWTPHSAGSQKWPSSRENWLVHWLFGFVMLAPIASPQIVQNVSSLNVEAIVSFRCQKISNVISDFPSFCFFAFARSARSFFCHPKTRQL